MTNNQSCVLLIWSEGIDMPSIFNYRARDKSGKFIAGSLTAEDLEDVANKLEGMDYFPISIQKEDEAKKERERHLLPFQRVKLGEIITFSHQLSDLLEGGLPLNKAILIIHKGTQNRKLKTIIEEISKDVQQGTKFSSAISKYPEIFPHILAIMIKVGESGGELNETLNKAYEYLEKVNDLKTKITSAMVYPSFLIVIGIIAIVFLMGFVIPKLVFIFQDLGQNLPLPTLMLISCSRFISNYWWFLLATIGIIAFGLNRILSSVSGRFLMHKLLLSLPFIGKMIKKIEVLKFAQTLGTLLTNGVPMLEALQVVSLSSKNLIIKSGFERIYKEIDAGKKISESLCRVNGLFPGLIISTLQVAEEGGFLEKALLKIASTCEREIDKNFKIITSLIEPIVILIMGLVVGFIVIAMLLPIFKINMVIQ